MLQTITCPSCQRQLKLPDTVLAHEVACPSCKATFVAGAQPSPFVAPVPLTAPAPRTTPARRPKAPDDYGSKEMDHRAAAPSAAAGPPRRRRKVWPVAILVVLFAGCLGLVYLTLRESAKQRAINDRVEARQDRARAEEEERQRKRQEAIRNLNPQTREELQREVQARLDALGKALAANDSSAIAAHMDVERLFDEIQATGIVRKEPERAATLRGFTKAVGEDLAKMQQVRWTSSKITYITATAPLEIAVVVTHRLPSGRDHRFLWWFSRQSGQWKAFDFEDLESGWPYALNWAASVAAEEGAGDFLRAQLALHEAHLLLSNGGGAAAVQAKLDSIAAVKLPTRAEGYRLVLKALLLLQQQRIEEAISTLNEAALCRPDVPGIDVLRGTLLNVSGKFTEAVPYLEAGRQCLGDDPLVCQQLAISRLETGRPAEAAALFRICLDLDPQSTKDLAGLVRAASQLTDKGDLEVRVARGVDRKVYPQLVGGCMQRRDGATLLPIALGARQSDPTFAFAEFHLAMARLWSGKPAEACEALAACLKKSTDPVEQRNSTTVFLEEMARAGFAVQAYAVAPDRRDGFATLASLTRTHHGVQCLKPLVAAHAAKDPDDPLLASYRAEFLAYEGKFVEADRIFTAAAGLWTDPKLRSQFHRSRLLVRYRIGGAVSALEQIASEDAFRQLALLCLEDGDSDTLDQLLAARDKRAADEADSLGWRARMKLRLGRPAEAAELFKAALTKVANDDKHAQLTWDFNFAAARDGYAIEAYGANPGAEAAFATLADQLLDWGRLGDLRRLIDVHTKAHPGHDRIPLLTARLHAAQRDWDKVAAVLLKVWQNTPAEGHTERLHADLVTALYRSGKGAAAIYSELPSRDTYVVLSDLLRGDGKAVEWLALLSAHRPRAAEAEAADLLFDEARAKALAGKSTDAVLLLKEAFAKQTNRQRRGEYVSVTSELLAAAGHSLEAYRASPDRVLALRGIAAVLLARNQLDDLATVLAEHAASHPKEPWGLYYQGELHLRRGEAAQAEAAFRAALALSLHTDAPTFRTGVLRAQIKAGKVADAYRDLGTGPVAFTQLARLCLDAKNADALRALLDAQRETGLEDHQAVTWELELCWLKNDAAGALKLLDQYRHGVLALPEFRARADALRVRALVRLKRAPDAVAAAEALAARGAGDAVLLALAHAAAGDEAKLLAVAEQYGPALTDRLYADDEAGPLVGGEEFAAFRMRYPEPKGAR
jgi:predicted Zn-dependent protease